MRQRHSRLDRLRTHSLEPAAFGGRKDMLISSLCELEADGPGGVATVIRFPQVCRTRGRCYEWEVTKLTSVTNRERATLT